MLAPSTRRSPHADCPARSSRIRPELPARRDLGRPRDQLRGVFRARAPHPAVRVRSDRPQGAGAPRPARMHRRDLARLPAQRASGHRVRVSRGRPVPAAARPPLQPDQAAARPIRAQAGRPVPLVGRAVRLSPAFEPRGPVDGPARLGARDAEVRGGRRGVRLEHRPAPARVVAQHGDLRDPRARRVDAACRVAPARARHVRGVRAPGVHRSPAVDRRDDGRAAARPRVPAAARAREPRAAQLLGLRHGRVLRAGPAYLATRRLDEMRIAIRQLHAAGIEVVLDVVYNHTCEGNEPARRCRGAASTTRATTG